jgi:hypothetical protein
MDALGYFNENENDTRLLQLLKNDVETKLPAGTNLFKLQVIKFYKSMQNVF